MPVTSTSPERPLDRHLVAGQRAGLVRADRRGRSERLHRGQLLHDRVPPGHPLHAESEHHRKHRRKTLGNGGHRQRNPDEQHVHHVARLVDPRCQQDRRDHDRRHRQDGDAERPAHVADLALQRGRLLLGLA
jgi:hypothetical protein